LVVISNEMIHDARIIPVDGRPHLPAAIRQWDGDSRGHWEGDTLVVETTNFTDRGMPVNQAPPVQSAAFRTVERFTPVGPNKIDYSVTFDDPKLFTRPWTAAFPYNRDEKFRIFEYACHEGNQEYMVNTLRNGRLRDARDAEARKKQDGK